MVVTQDMFFLLKSAFSWWEKKYMCFSQEGLLLTTTYEQNLNVIKRNQKPQELLVAQLSQTYSKHPIILANSCRVPVVVRDFL